MKTGSHLKVTEYGTNSMGVTLEGDPRKPEPIYFIVRLPWGDVEISRVDNVDGPPEYWVHVSSSREDDIVSGFAQPGKIVDSRIDADGKAPHHLAVRLVRWEPHVWVRHRYAADSRCGLCSLPHGDPIHMKGGV